MNLIIGALIILNCLFLAHGKLAPGLPPPEEGCKWVPYSLGDKIPPYAMVGGHDTGNYPMYVGRCRFRDFILPAKITPGLNVMTTSYDGVEWVPSSCDILIVGNGFSWVRSTGDHVPLNALLVDINTAQNPIYIGRVPKDLTLTVGKVDWPARKFYIGYNSTEIAFDHWETLVGPIIACND